MFEKLIKNNILFSLILFLFVFLWYAILGKQGICMTDEGYALTGSYFFFRDVEVIKNQLIYYNGYLIGGLWSLLINGGSIYDFRILGALFHALTALVVYYTLKDNVSNISIFIGIFFVILNKPITVFNHNDLTALLVCLSVYFIFKGYKARNIYLFFLSGFLVGVNIFTRLPNILIFMVIIMYIYMCYNDKKMLKNVISFLIGGIVGFFSEILYLYIAGHLYYFLENILDVVNMSTDSKSEHGISNLLLSYYNNYRDVIYQIIYMTSVPLIVAFFKKHIHFNNLLYRIFIILSCVLYIIILWKQNQGTITLYAIGLPLCLYGLLLIDRSSDKFFLMGISVLVAILLPIGSDLGLVNMGTNSIWLLLPCSFEIFNEYVIKKIDEFHIEDSFAVIIIVVLFFRFSFYISLECCGESGSRLKKIYKIDSEYSNVYTKYDYHLKLNSLISNLRKVVEKDDKVLLYESLPLVHFLTRTKPYLYNSWPWVYSPEKLHKVMKEVSGNKKKPVVVVQKGIPNADGWTKYNPTYNDLSAIDSRIHSNRKISIINDYISYNKYLKYWENDIFIIYTPQN